MPDFSPLYAAVVLFVVGAAAGVCGHIVASWALRRRLYSLEYEVATVQDQLIREIKRRAGSETGKAKKADQELLDKMQTGGEPARQPMWWEQYVGKARDL